MHNNDEAEDEKSEYYKTRRAKINKIVEQVEDWDLKTLIDYAKMRMKEALLCCSDQDLDDELAAMNE